MSGSVLPSASLADMRRWAQEIMRREPDFLIGPDRANPYIRRWYVVPRNPWCDVYLHEILHSDDDRALHDHPWANRSVLIEGGYVEHMPDGRYARFAGDVVDRPAEALHRLVLPEGARAVSLFMTGPKVREWGFACPQGWVHWADFVDPANPGLPGRGCGEGAMEAGGPRAYLGPYPILSHRSQAELSSDV